MTLKVKFVEDDGAMEEIGDEGEGDVHSENDGDIPLDGKHTMKGEEPPAKKLKKRDLIEEAENNLQLYNDALQDISLSTAEKFSKISSFLQYLYENNVNTLEFKNDFSEWAKNCVTTLINEVSTTSAECYDFLSNILKTAPTIVEPLCEKILELIFLKHSVNPECDQALEFFMEKLSFTFEKLRRYPKLIAKLLCSARDNVGKLTETKKDSRKRKSSSMRDSTAVSRFVLSRRFISSYSTVLSMLPSGQVIDLWKTLQHNLEEECVKKLKLDPSNPSLITLLTIVADLTVGFLYNVKVADYSVPASTVDKMNEVMSRLRDHALGELGKLVCSGNNANLTRIFLKLSLSWGYMNQFLTIYNDSYNDLTLKSEPQQNYGCPEDLTILLPFLSEEWKTLLQAVAKTEDFTSLRLTVGLVALKLKYLAVIDQKLKESHGNFVNEQSHHEVLNRCLQEASEFVWNNQEHLGEMEESFLLCGSREDILDIASAYMDHEKIIQHAKTFLENKRQLQLHLETLAKPDGASSRNNVTLLVAVILEALQEGLKRVAKMNLMKRPVKKFISECLTTEWKVTILKGLVGNEIQHQTHFTEEQRKMILEAVQIVNDAISEKITGKGKIENEVEHMPDFLNEIVFFLGREGLAHYPKIVKTIMFLCCSLIFTALIGHVEYKDVVKELVSILSECGGNANEFLFHVKWSAYFQLVNDNKEVMSSKCCERICKLILENIYISSKVGTQFAEENLKMITENFDLGGTSKNLGLCVLDHILQEQVEKGNKSKSATLLLNHTRELGAAVVRNLSEGSVITELHGLIQPLKKMKKVKKRKSGGGNTSVDELINKLDSSTISDVLHACSLLLKGKTHMNAETVSELQVILPPYLQFALDFLEVCTVESEKINGEIRRCIFYCGQLLNEVLKTFDEFREKLGQEYLLRLWDCCCAKFTNENSEVISSEEDFQIGILKLILEVANENEFETICNSILEGIGGKQELPINVYTLNSLVEAGLSDEKKKRTRRIAIEASLYKYLYYVQQWRESDKLPETAITYLQFQTALVRRRKPMGNLNSLAVCFVSVSAIPFDKIENVETFRRVFSQVCELLNAITIHRLDVLSFRTHIFLQCFQFLVESLVKKSDQQNKLTDREIFDLRHCGHCIERICQSAKLGRQEFTRISPYLVKVVLQQFEKITVYPIVKNPLLNGCYKLLDLCDENGIAHVNSMLSVGSREMFKTAYDMYKKFYRYKGKV